MLIVEDHGPRARVLRLDRPDSLNAMTVDLVDALHRELDALATDRDVSVVVLTGQGRGFCAGLDLNGYGGEDRVPGDAVRQTRWGPSTQAWRRRCTSLR
ncbi:enoyl-CoA hydratase/isomerase family protein [Gordonia liuliyuniae]|uniref:enoyl-CoA hydratase/isomerase family protein n=1 Tax=Gordonia liuliyuniae TaxID=2911517 RepID=UPI00224551F4|nr:enoyl-CoA hydratase/isomerase family protein [Gordonia liuliyuniae]